MNTASKIVSLEALQKILTPLRKRGFRVVFTNGCFDLLHGGHVSLLERARSLGDLLVVGLNTDRSVRRLKGPSRPVVPEAERARILAALACVDYVVLFEEETPLRLIQTIEPDILVKGGDWALEQVVGREVVESRGGKVLLLPLEPGISTSRRIQAIRQQEASEG